MIVSMNLYAQNTITYKLDGVTLYSDIYTYGDAYTIRAIMPTKTNHRVLKNWYLDSACTNKVSGTAVCEVIKLTTQNLMLYILFKRQCFYSSDGYTTDGSGFIKKITDGQLKIR